MQIDRREFLRRVGLGSIALGSLPSLINALRIPAQAQGRINYHLLVVSFAGPAGAHPPGTPAAPLHQLVLGGQGSFDPSSVASSVSGGGFFVHNLFPGANPPAGGTPLPIVASGTWGNGRLVSWSPNRTYGVQGTGVLQMVIDVYREIPDKTVIRGALLKVVCVSGAAGVAIPGELEGITLSIPGTEFSAGGTPGPFTPAGPFPSPRGPGTSGAPGIGVTAFSIAPIPS